MACAWHVHGMAWQGQGMEFMWTLTVVSLEFPQTRPANSKLSLSLQQSFLDSECWQMLSCWTLRLQQPPTPTPLGSPYRINMAHTGSEPSARSEKIMLAMLKSHMRSARPADLGDEVLCRLQFERGASIEQGCLEVAVIRGWQSHSREEVGCNALEEGHILAQELAQVHIHNGPQHEDQFLLVWEPGPQQNPQYVSMRFCLYSVGTSKSDKAG